MSWAQRLKRVFGIEIEACARCSARLKVIANIEDPAVIARILAHLDRTADTVGVAVTLKGRRESDPVEHLRRIHGHGVGSLAAGAGSMALTGDSRGTWRSRAGLAG